MIEDLISIIIPVYNVDRYLPKCLDSVLCQVYRNLEIILIDDGSTDNSGDICDEYAKKDIRIKVFHQSNKGLSAARNVGLSHAHGEYIGFVDSDDWIAPDMYRSLYTEMVVHKADMATCAMYMVINEIVYMAKKTWTGETELLITKEAVLSLLVGVKINTSVWNKLYRKKILLTTPFPEGHVYEDLYVMPDLFLKCEKIAYIDTPYYYYHCFREGSICNSFSAKHMKDWFEAGIFRNGRIKECYPELERLVWQSQIVYDVCLYCSLVHEMKNDPELKELAWLIRQDMKKYSLSCLLDIRIYRRPAAIILKYFPMGILLYAFMEKAVRKLIERESFYKLKYHRIG